MTYMNDASVDRLMDMFNELSKQIETYGFSDLDLQRLKRLQAKLDTLIKKMKQEMEKD